MLNHNFYRIFTYFAKISNTITVLNLASNLKHIVLRYKTRFLHFHTFFAIFNVHSVLYNCHVIEPVLRSFPNSKSCEMMVFGIKIFAIFRIPHKKNQTSWFILRNIDKNRSFKKPVSSHDMLITLSYIKPTVPRAVNLRPRIVPLILYRSVRTAVRRIIQVHRVIFHWIRGVASRRVGLEAPVPQFWL